MKIVLQLVRNCNNYGKPYSKNLTWRNKGILIKVRKKVMESLKLPEYAK